MPFARSPIVLVVAVVLAYGPSLRNGFVFDDAIFVRDDPRVRTLGEAPRLFIEPLWGYLDEDGVRHTHQYYRPLQTFPLALSRAVFGDQAWPGHLLNVVVHAVNALLVWSIFSVLFARSAPALALALLWAAHPAYSEAVLWVSNLAGLGVAIAILGVLRLHLSRSVEGWRGCLAMSCLLLAGLLFHEIAIVIPALLIAFELIVVRPPRLRRLAGELVACVPALLIYLWLRQRALGGILPGMGSNPMTVGELVLNGIALLPQYGKAFVWPFDLNMYHDFDPVNGAADPAFIGGIAMTLLAACVLVATLRRKPVAAFAIVWMAVTTLPYLLIRWPQLNVFAERYLYLPSIGLFLLVGGLLTRNNFGELEPARRQGMSSLAESVRSPVKGTRAVEVQSASADLTRLSRETRSPAGRPNNSRAGTTAIITIALLSVIGILTIWRRTPDWRDDMTLYTKTLTQSRRAVLIRNNLAVRLLEQKRYDDGIRVLQEVADSPAATSDTWHNMGLLRAAAGDDRGAVFAFRRARRYGIPKLSTVLNLGYMYDRVGQHESAVETYMQLVDRAPDYAPAWFNLAMVAFEAGQYNNARIAVDHVLEVSPEDQQALALQRRLADLAAAGRASLPAAPAATKRMCRQAMRQARRGRYRDAMIQLRAAAWLNERAPLPHQYLANVAALRGEWETALAESREALQRSPGSPLYRRNVEALERKLAESRSR